jgi:hypothetical protein
MTRKKRAVWTIVVILGIVIVARGYASLGL